MRRYKVEFCKIKNGSNYLSLFNVIQLFNKQLISFYNALNLKR